LYTTNSTPKITGNDALYLGYFNGAIEYAKSSYDVRVAVGFDLLSPFVDEEQSEAKKQCLLRRLRENEQKGSPCAEIADVIECPLEKLPLHMSHPNMIVKKVIEYRLRNKA